MLRHRDEMKSGVIEKCHEGEGNLLAHFVMGQGDSDAGVLFMHDDVIEPGASIGEHRHEGNEEIYLVIEGHGTMILDGKEYPFRPGDVSLVKSGHTHGLRNSADGPMRLIVVCVKG